ncbi:hypothetical protein ACOSP7_015617 [Xanthoceras sorbifolium]
METRGKINAEFRNEVNEILARHESSFDQVNATLQAILTELQSLRISRSPHKVNTELNPFAPGESSYRPDQPYFNNRSHRHLKLSFPKFNGEDPTGWVYKAEQYFDFKSIAVDQQVQLASFHLEGIALQWYLWFTKFKGPLTWDEFNQVVLQRFGPTDFEDPSEALTRFKQTTMVTTYQETFEKLSHRVDDKIRLNKIPSSQPTLVATKANPNPTAGLLGPPPNKTPTTFQRITSQEVIARREKGLCYYCNEKYVPGHHCRRLQLFMIEDSLQSNYFPPDEPQSKLAPIEPISQFYPCRQG